MYTLPIEIQMTAVTGITKIKCMNAGPDWGINLGTGKKVPMGLSDLYRRYCDMYRGNEPVRQFIGGAPELMKFHGKPPWTCVQARMHYRPKNFNELGEIVDDITCTTEEDEDDN